MNQWLLRRPSAADVLLEGLSTEQYVDPHATVADALHTAQRKLGFCPQAAENAVRWLQLDDRQPIGRLRRTELTQLARCIDRFWQQAIGAAAATSAQPG